MTAPVLAYKKFYVVNPFEQYNYIKNPTFASPDFVEDWTASGAGVTIEATGDEQRFGAYSMKVNTASGVVSGAYFSAAQGIVKDVTYTFSAYVLAEAGKTIRLYMKDAAPTRVKEEDFIATGYWQRLQISYKAADTNDLYPGVERLATASTAPFYVDGCQFEHWKATTFFDGYSPGCRWTGAPRNSTSYRSANTGLGGELVDLDTYCKVVQVTGLGHGDWNQILTKMTSGGDMYQTHIRKSRNFSIIVDFLGNSLSEIEANRAAVIDLLRPDKLSNRKVDEQFGINWGADYRGHEQRIIRYQGVDVNGYEATNPVDIVCVPLPDTLTDTPDLPTYQRAILNFTIPSGLLDGAYNEGTELDLNADFPAEFIVKRDPNGNWVKWTGGAYASLITGLNGAVYCMAEGPDGKIYVGGNFIDAGGVAGADKLARWNPVTDAWEAIGSLTSGKTDLIRTMAFDAIGDLYIGGNFDDWGDADGDGIVKITDLEGTPAMSSLGSGIDGYVRSIVIDSNGNVFAGGLFNNAGGVSGANNVAMWNGTAWSALSTGLNNQVDILTVAPNGDLYIGGVFTDVAYPRLCRWNGTAFSVVGTNTDINNLVSGLDFGANGYLYVSGTFTNAGGIANADYIARWNGASWESLGTGTNGWVTKVFVNAGKVYVCGDFTTAGGLILTDRVAVWSNGAWQPFDIDLPGTASVYSILPASDGSLYVGGAFTTAGTAGTPNAECGIISDRMLAIGVASASANTYPFIQVYGPGTLKSITNYSTGKSVWFDGLTLQPGEWINLNFDPLNLKFRGGWDGRGNLMRYVIPGSDYGDFYLKPGWNGLSLYMTEATTDSGATIAWTPKFWGLDGALL